MRLRAAIYTRKSTSQEGVSEDARSTTRQRELARGFASAKGWTVADEHIYTDEAISGAEFKNRAGLASLLVAAQRTPRPFDVIVTMDESRIGRDQYRTAAVLQQIADSGVELWYYQDARKAQLDTATGKFLESVRGFAAEMEREKARARTREALRAKAKAGHFTGGNVYGYRSVKTGSHSQRVIHEPEAQVIRRIFTMASQGKGILRIAKALNAERIPAPKHHGWANTVISEMLRRPLYRGQVIYGKTRWEDKGGTKKKVAASDPFTRDAPELRIVPEALWQAAHARLDRTRQTYTGKASSFGKQAVKPEAGLDSRHLLSGFLRCGVCGGNLFAKHDRKHILFYRCTVHHNRGTVRCTNRWGVPYHDITKAVLSHFKRKTLEDAVSTLILAQSEQIPNIEDQRKPLRDELRKLDRELGRLTDAIKAGGQLKPLVEALQATQTQRDDVTAKLEHLEGLEKAAEEVELDDVEMENLARLQDHLSTTNPLEVHIATGRQVLRQLLPTPITVTPTVAKGKLKGWQYQGQGALDRLLKGQLKSPMMSGPPRRCGRRPSP